MKEGDIVYLKSSSQKMLIEKVIEPKSKEGGMDNIVNDSLAVAPHARVGDYAVKWGNKAKEKDILPKEAVIDNLGNLADKTTSEIKIGNVVISKLNDTPMTVCWVVNDTNNPNSIYSYNEILIMTKGRKSGDLVCRWFEGNELKTGYFSPLELEKLKE